MSRPLFLRRNEYHAAVLLSGHWEEKGGGVWRFTVRCVSCQRESFEELAERSTAEDILETEKTVFARVAIEDSPEPACSHAQAVFQGIELELRHRRGIPDWVL